MPEFQDLTDQEFNSLTVLYLSPQRNKHGRTVWVCRCTCGNEQLASGNDLKQGGIKACQQCGRKRKSDRMKKLNKIPRYGVAEYNSWQGMRSRCNYEKHTHYAIYGGKGIKVDPRWDSYENFLLDMGPKPSPEHSLERLDSDGDYTPSNTVWATATEQANNKTNNHLMTLNGETKTMMQWSIIAEIPYSTLRARSRKRWTDERALTTPVRPLANSHQSSGKHQESSNQLIEYHSQTRPLG